MTTIMITNIIGNGLGIDVGYDPIMYPFIHRTLAQYKILQYVY